MPTCGRPRARYGAGDVLPVFMQFEWKFPALVRLRAKSWDMKKSKFTEEQIAFALKQVETGTPEPSGISTNGAPLSSAPGSRWTTAR